MSYADYEESIYHGEPVDLYLFTYGSGASDFYAFTDAEIPITVDGKTYVPAPIDRDAFNSSGTLDKSGIKVFVEALSPVAELYRVYPPTQPVTLMIRHGHIGDPDNEFHIVWTGRALSCAWEEDSVASITCEPVSTSMQRTGLRRHWQYGCPHALYMGDSNGGCRASKAAATQTVTITGVSGALVTLPAGWNGVRDKAKFLNGLVEWTTPSGAVQRRTIIKVDAAANVLTMGGLIPGLAAGATVGVVLGCNRQMDDCKDLHNNINDFGGQPWIPTKNPFGQTQNFY